MLFICSKYRVLKAIRRKSICKTLQFDIKIEEVS